MFKILFLYSSLFIIVIMLKRKIGKFYGLYELSVRHILMVRARFSDELFPHYM